MSVKVQITLPEDLARDLNRTAARRKVSVAQFIRETMQQRLRTDAMKAANHPLASIIGLADGEDTDLASRVDEILYR